MNIRDLPGIKYLAKNHSYGYLLVVILIFIIGSGFSILYWNSDQSQAEKEQVAKFQQDLNASKSIIVESLNQYSLLLDDGSSLLNVTGNNISQSQWLTFFQSYNLPVNYPGVDAVSFSQYVPAADLAHYLSTLSAQGYPNFSITPSGNRSAYAPVTYIGYVSPTSLKALGYDQLSNSVRAAAILKATDSGDIAMSGKVNLVAVNKQQDSFLIYKPVYSGPSTTLAQRQTSIYGFVFIAVTSNTFFNDLLGPYINSSIAVQVYDQQIKSANLMYESPKYSSAINHITSPVSSVLSVNFGGHVWEVRVITSKAVIQSSGSQPSNTILIVGTSLSLVAALLVWYFTYYRERRIYWEKQTEIQSAKDELLSLASHQLRTPATIVKQYLGILLQHYGGEITKEQQKIIKMAYDSNERQLDIANQFLNAARLGSGRIELSCQRLSLTDVINQVVVEHRHLASKRHQKIAFTKPKGPIYVQADPKYLPMVFENLLNNAIKYSKRQSRITVKLNRQGSNAIITVKDQGIGIAKEELPGIFDKFSHASNLKSRDGIGTGIGLYLAKQITELHGGDILVKSKLNEGAEFSVQLPLKSSQKKQ